MYKNKEELKNEIIKKYQNVGFFRRIFAWKDIVAGIENEIDKLDITTDNSELMTNFENSTKEIQKLRQDLEMIKTEKDSLNKEYGALKEQLTTTNSQMLEYTRDIHKIFNSSTGRQGKISEIRLKEVLIASFGTESDVWIENLPVDKGIVEFAIKISSGDKWVPVDSKSYIPELNENNEFIIDSSYVNKVKKAGEEIASKYVGKNNTESFGLLVLPSEEVYVSLFEEDNSLFQHLADRKVHITSPSNFISFVQTLANLNNKMEAVSASESIIKEISTAYDHMVNFYNSTKEGVDKLNTAFDSHMSKAGKKLNQVSDNLDTTKKIK